MQEVYFGNIFRLDKKWEDVIVIPVLPPARLVRHPARRLVLLRLAALVSLLPAILPVVARSAGAPRTEPPVGDQCARRDTVVSPSLRAQLLLPVLPPAGLPTQSPAIVSFVETLGVVIDLENK